MEDDFIMVYTDVFTQSLPLAETVGGGGEAQSCGEEASPLPPPSLVPRPHPIFNVTLKSGCGLGTRLTFI